MIKNYACPRGVLNPLWTDGISNFCYLFSQYTVIYIFGKHKLKIIYYDNFLFIKTIDYHNKLFFSFYLLNILTKQILRIRNQVRPRRVKNYLWEKKTVVILTLLKHVNNNFFQGKLKYLFIFLALLVHAFLISHIHCYNILYFNLPSYSLNKLQRIQNFSARLITQTQKFQHIKPILKQLHWQPVKESINFKMALQVFNPL